MSHDINQWHDEIALRQASLADARKELEGGELSAEDFAAIEARELKAIALANVAMTAFALRPEIDDAQRRPRARRRSLLLVAVVCLTFVVVMILWSSLALRQAGTSGTGSLTLATTQRIQQLLDEAEADTANGNDVAALAAYQQVLQLDPKNVSALTQTGWLDFSAGSSGHNVTLTNLGVDDLRQAITLAPTLAAPRLYYAIVAASTPGNTALATQQFEVFLSLKPSVGQLAVARPFLQKLKIKVP